MNQLRHIGNGRYINVDNLVEVNASWDVDKDTKTVIFYAYIHTVKHTISLFGRAASMAADRLEILYDTKYLLKDSEYHVCKTMDEWNERVQNDLPY